ncbi:MAG: hypothetical protein COA62_11545 [Rhodobiaceae bacterium]|nr:MAG: hypothetical protein COA62_11545 [Rhodobiaceae bacterium]
MPEAKREISEAAKADLAKHKTDRVELVAHDPAWADMFAQIAHEVRMACGDLIVDIHHIGSTSVPELSAKPLIDLMPVLNAFADGARCADILEPLGFYYHREYGIPGRQFFRQRGPVNINMHMFERGHVEIERHLVFRDALRSDAELKAAYEDLKRGLAAKFPNDIDSYAMAKSTFIEGVLQAQGAPERPSGPDC